LKRLAVLVLAVVTGACASSRQPVAVPSPTPKAREIPVITPSPASPRTPTPTPTPPPAPAPVPMPASDTAPPLVRILLERSKAAVGFPQPGRPYRVLWDGGSHWMWGPLQAAPEAGETWQIGAWGDPATAEAAASRAAAGLGGAARVVQVRGDDGLTRVRIHWPGASKAEIRTRLTALGFGDAVPVAEDARVRLSGSAGVPVVGREIRVVPWGEYPTACGGGRYRGRFVLRASGGTVLVINELNLEAYLRGVVPAEMGPLAFPQLAALEAQAVAARTYAVAHLGEHDDEGYDLCDTPACQVYRGVAVEHKLTDRAVRETAGIIAVYKGRPIDAMYTSTCGGRTEDAAALFPDRAQPYLRGVACAWDRPMRIKGSGTPSGWMGLEAFFAGMTGTVLGLEEPVPLSVLMARLASRCNGRVIETPGGAGSEAVARALLAAGGLEDAATALARGDSALGGLLELGDLFGIRIPEPPPVVDRRWVEAAALAVLRLQGKVVRETGEAVPRPDGVGIFPRRAPHSEPLGSDPPLYERWEGQWRRVRSAEVLPGTRLERYRAGRDMVALVVDRSGGGGDADRRSAWRSWVRELSWNELGRRLGMPGLAEIRVTRRSASGRVVGLVAIDASGRRKEWSGFAVRRALGLPETLFAMHRVTGTDGEQRVRFMGRGWGHGVGLCQNGAYGLARAGMTYDAILRHYYTGIGLVRWDGERPAD